MSYSTQFTGRIEISPPIPWHLVEGSRYLSPAERRTQGLRPTYTDLVFVVRTEKRDTDEGVLTVVNVVAIEGVDDETRGDAAGGELEDIVKEFGQGRTFTGVIEALGEENTDMWRLKVIDGKVIRFEPTITWPEESK